MPPNLAVPEMAETRCPDDNTLRDFVLGRLDGPLSDPVESHLARCRRCGVQLLGMPLDDPLLDLLKQIGNERGLDDPEAEALARSILINMETRCEAGGETRFASSAGESESIEPDVPDPAQLIGGIERLGNFRILGVLGRGGMGFVCEAVDERLQRRVALKLMQPALSLNPLARERFLREARAVASLKHPGIVSIYEVGEHDGVPFLAMELLAGETLEQCLQRDKTLAAERAAAMGAACAAGLSAAHAKGLLHRDVKPANIWLETSEDEGQTGVTVKLLDFGLARPMEPTAGMTQSGMLLGTPRYLSPEQARGEALDGRSDLFSLGCVLYRMVTGTLPFDGPNLMSQLNALAAGEPTRVRELQPEVPPELADLIHRLLAKSREDRPATAALVASELRRISRECTAAKEPSGDSSQPPAVAEFRGRSGSGRNRAIAAGWAGAAAIALLGAFIFIWRRDDGSEIRLTIESKPPVKQEEAVAPPGNLPPSPIPKETVGTVLVLDQFEARQIPSEERFPGQPPELVAVLGTHRLREWRLVTAVEFHPTGEFVLPTVQGARSQNLWSLASGSASRPFPEGVGSEIEARFSPDGNWLFSLGVLYRVKLDADGGPQFVLDRVLPRTRLPWGQFSPDSQWLVTLDPAERQLLLWDLRQPQLQGIPSAEFNFEGMSLRDLRVAAAPDRLVAEVVDGMSEVRTATFDVDWSHPDRPRFSNAVLQAGRWVAAAAAPRAVSCTPDGAVSVFDLSQPEPRALHTLQTMGARTMPADLAPAGDVLATTDGGTLVRVYRDAAGDWLLTDEVRHPSRVDVVRISPDGTRLCVSGQEGLLRVWDIRSSPIRELHPAAPATMVVRLTVSDDGNFVGVAGWNGQAVYDLRANPPRLIDLPEMPFNRDGNWSFSSARSWALFPGDPLWDLSSNPPQPLSRPLGDEAFPAATYQFSPREHELVRLDVGQAGSRFDWLPWTIDARGTLQLGNSTRSWTLPDSSFYVQQVNRRHGRVLATNNETGLIRVYDWNSSSNPRTELSGFPGNVRHMRMSRSGDLVVTWSGNRTGRLWDLQESPPREHPIPNFMRAVEFSLDENSLWLAGEDHVTQYDWRLGRELHRIAMPGAVHGLELHPDGRHLLTVNGNGTVYVLRLPR